MMTEFISRNHGHSCYEIIIKTTDPEHYKATEDFARRLIGHAKPVTDNNDGCKWIPVTERLPDKMMQCVCRYVFGSNDEYPFYQTFWYFASDENPHFQNEGSMGMRVTHWMPLPDPPQEVSDGQT